VFRRRALFRVSSFDGALDAARGTLARHYYKTIVQHIRHNHYLLVAINFPKLYKSSFLTFNCGLVDGSMAGLRPPSGSAEFHSIRSVKSVAVVLITEEHTKPRLGVQYRATYKLLSVNYPKIHVYWRQPYNSASG
jgi:hypothetical protein